MSEVNFILSYSVFLFFVILIIGFGAPSFMPDSARQRFEEINLVHTCDQGCPDGQICDDPSGVCKSKWASYPIIGYVYGFFKGVYDFLYVLYLLLSFSSTIRWITLLLVSPLLIVTSYIILGILRGGK